MFKLSYLFFGMIVGFIYGLVVYDLVQLMPSYTFVVVGTGVFGIVMTEIILRRNN